MRQIGTLGIIAFLFASSLGSCGNVGDEIEEPKSRRDRCAEEETNVDLKGQWRLTGNGIRSDCEDSIYNGDISINTGVTFNVAQQAQPENAGVDTLSISNRDGDVPESFSLTGSADGSCVDFETRERTKNYSLIFQFSGDAVGNIIEGEFSGTGPTGCVSGGTFQVQITP